MEENLRLLISEPRDEIVFLSPHEKGTQTKLKLINPGVENIYFKVLTTDPLAFCVKPKMGCVPPGLSMEVLITLRNDDPKYYLDKQPKFKVLAIENSCKGRDPKALWNGDKFENLSSLRFSCTFIDNGNDSEGCNPQANMSSEDRCPAHYETSGSNMSLKESQFAASVINPPLPNPTKSFSFKYLVLSIIFVIIASVSATKLYLDKVIVF